MPGGPVAIVGATATGKTALALDLALRFDGEIVNVDSRQVYTGMDIGTAKPTPGQQRLVRHWLVDVADPRQPFTLALFLDLARDALDGIASRGRRAFVVGGTGQYLWALLEGWQVPRVPPDPRLRAELEAIAARDGVEALARILLREDPVAAETIDRRNPRRLIRAIEVTRRSGRPFSAWRGARAGHTAASAIIGLDLPRAALHQRIDARVDAMLAAGLVDEVRALNAAGVDCGVPAMDSIGYRQVCDHLAGRCTLQEAAARTKTETHRLARMQHAWFRRDDARIRWLDAASPRLVEEAAAIVAAIPSG